MLLQTEDGKYNSTKICQTTKIFKIDWAGLRVQGLYSVLPAPLLGHTLNDHGSLSGSICSAADFFSLHTFSVVFHYVLLSELFILSFSDLSNCIHFRMLTFLLLSKGSFIIKGLKTD